MKILIMAMSVDWEYFFPEVYFKHDRFKTLSKEDWKKVIDSEGYWSPQKDFEFYMEKLKVDSKYFDEKNLKLFPKDFNKPIYSIEIFETARIKLLHRVKISNGEGMCGYDEEGTEFTTFKILLDGIYESVEVDPGTIGNKENKYQINTTKNVISSHRFNSIYFLYNWLLSLNPRGSYDNNWQIFAYGITEYDDTMTYVDTFIDQTGTGKVDAIVNLTLSSDNESYPSTESKESVMKTLKDWNPFI